jgi:hypothetical protein
MVGGLALAVAGLFIAFGAPAAAIAAIVGGIGIIVVSVKDMIENGKTLENQVGATVGVIVSVLGVIGGVIAGIIAWPVAVAAAVAALGVLIYTWWDEIAAFFASIGAWINDNVIQPVVNFFKGLWDGVVAIFSPAVDWFNSTFIEPLVYLFSAIVSTVSTFFSQLWNNVVAIFSYAANWFSYYVITPIVNFFSPIVESIGSVFVQLWENIKSIWNTVANWFNAKVIQPIVNFFSGLWDGILNIFNKVKDFFAGISEAIKSAFKGAINFVIDILNFFIRAINSIGFDLPAFPGQEAIHVGFNIPEIPRLAVGMDFVPYDNYLAYLHQGETVLPASQASTLRALGGVSGVVSALNSLSSANVTGELPAHTFRNGTTATSIQIDYVRLAAAFSQALQENAEIFQNEQGDIVIGDETIVRSYERGVNRMGNAALRKPALTLG